VDEQGIKLINTTRKCLDEAIKLVRPGTLYRDIGNTIDQVASADGFSVVRSYCGHGVNSMFHSPPNIPHYAKNKAIGTMKVSWVYHSSLAWTCVYH
jgi:methionyl aminopeptidase